MLPHECGADDEWEGLSDIAFGPDGHALVGSSSNGASQVWRDGGRPGLAYDAAGRPGSGGALGGAGPAWAEPV